jgi:hypothetical protein
MVSYGFQPGAGRRRRPKKEPPFPAAFEVDNREASNRVDRSHSVSKEDDPSHKRESLIDRKRGIFFSFHLPCRPLADHYIVMPGLVPGIHVFTSATKEKAWMAGTSPAMTRKVWVPGVHRYDGH